MLALPWRLGAATDVCLSAPRSRNAACCASWRWSARWNTFH